MLLVSALILGFAAWLCVKLYFWHRRFLEDGNWHPIDGKMRRFLDGKWQSREMTSAEFIADEGDRAW